VASFDAELAKDMARFYDDPLGFVMYAYPWDTRPSLQVVKLPAPYDLIYDSEFGPDLWACEELDAIGKLVKAQNFNGRDAADAIRRGIASGHGIGKSAFTAWIVDWLMSTRPNANGVVTANTSPQLASKTWAEVAKWTAMCITAPWFDVSTGRGSMAMRHKQRPESWKCIAQTCDEHNSESFAGLHAADSTPFFLFDEASAIPDKIWEVAEGGMTDGAPVWLAFGNPTRNTGKFHGIFNGKDRHRWTTRQIDSRKVAITNKKQLAKWEEDYGQDSDFFKVRVRGMFPSMSVKQFISVTDVDAAFGRKLNEAQYTFAPTILTCDPAWSGDDELVIGLRQGLAFQVLRTIPKNDNDMEIANMLMVLEDEHQADAVFIDAGYGTGIYSAGQMLGRDWTLVWFGSKSGDPGCLNKRAEMWNEMKKWIKAGGAIPADPVLHADLIGPETVPRPDGVIQLESKEDMKARGVPSPNRADALALSFAFPVTHRIRLKAHQARQGNPMDYDPMQHIGQQSTKNFDYDPLSRL